MSVICVYVGCESKGVLVVQENELCVRGGTTGSSKIDIFC